MFILTDDIKAKLVRDLSRNYKLKGFTYEFIGDALFCVYEGNTNTLIDYSDIPARFSYNKLLTGTATYLSDIPMAINNIYYSLKTISYPAFIKKIKAIKSEAPDGNVIEYKTNGCTFYFTATAIYTDRTGVHQLMVCITPELLKAHDVSVDVFFQDVAKCYLDDDVDILDPTYTIS